MTDIPTRFMADWLSECLSIALANNDRPAVDHFAARLRVVQIQICERKAA